MTGTRQIAEEIYSLGREILLRRPRRAFQLQAYPFKMTPPEHGQASQTTRTCRFWKMIKEGYDHFRGDAGRSRRVDFCEKKYVFDAAKPAGRPPRIW